MSADKTALVQQLGAKCADAQGNIAIDDLAKLCNWEVEPSVASGKKTIKERHEELKEAFQLQSRDGKITMEDLLDYFNDW